MLAPVAKEIYRPAPSGPLSTEVSGPGPTLSAAYKTDAPHPVTPTINATIFPTVPIMRTPAATTAADTHLPIT